MKKLKKRLINVLCSIMFINILLFPVVTYAENGIMPMAEWADVSWSSMPTVSTTDGTYYHDIGSDITTYGSNISTYYWNTGSNWHYDDMYIDNAMRVTYQKKFAVSYGSVLNLVGATKDEGWGGNDTVASGKIYWNIMEYNADGYVIYDSGWFATSEAYTVGVSSNGGVSNSPLSREDVKYVVILFRYATGDHSLGAPSPNITPTDVKNNFTNLYLCYKPFTYTINNEGSISTVNRTGIESIENLLPVLSKEGSVGLWRVTSNNSVGGDNWINGNTYTTDQLNGCIKEGKFYTSLFGDVTFTAEYTTNNYCITYYPNGGDGDEIKQYVDFGSDYTTKPANTFYKKGYTISSWNTKPDGTEATHTPGQDRTYEWEYSFDLYAQWKANIYEIFLDDDGADTSGTFSYCVKYGTGFYDDWDCATAITSITIPMKANYTFGGYYTKANGQGTQCIDSSGKIIAKNTEFADDTNLYAYWTKDTYTIKYDANGGSGTMSNATANSGASVTLSDNAFTRTGYTFKGWSKTSSGAVDYNNKASVKDLASAGGSVTLYAVWEPNVYKVTLDNQSATSAGTKEYYEKYNTGKYTTSGCTTSLSSITVPTKTGYTFNGYYTGTGGSGTQYINASGLITAGNTAFSKDTMLYAYWTVNSYTIKYNANGGTTSATSKTLNYGSPVDLSPTAEKEGYHFIGWSTSSTSRISLSSYIMPDKDVTLYAVYSISVSDVENHEYPSYSATPEIANDEVFLLVWIKGSPSVNKAYPLTYKKDVNAMVYHYELPQTDISSFVNERDFCYQLIAYDNAGNRAVLYEGAKGGGSIPSMEIKPQSPSLYTQTVKHYKQNPITGEWEWFETTSELVLQNTSYTPAYITPPTGYSTSSKDSGGMVSADKTYSAYYKPNMYTLTFHANGGSCSTASKQVTYGGYYGTLPIPEKTGYTFIGWNTASNGTGEKISSSQIYSKTSGSTVYAQWTPNVYTITLNSNGADTDGTKVYYEKYNTGKYTTSSCTTAISSITKPTKTGYTFNGYYSQTGGKGPQYISASGTITAGNAAFSADTTLYAYWIPNSYTITFYANGGSGTMNSQKVTYGEKVSLSSNLFTRTGYKFTGWAISSDGSFVYEDRQLVENLSAVNNATISLYALWEPNVYKVTLDHEDATTAGTPEYYEKYNTGNYTTSACTAAISNITKPTKKGYVFNGYYTGKNGTGTQYVDASGRILSIKTTFTDSITLYAYWTANTYTFKYNANGGSGTMADTPATYDQYVTLRTNTFLRTGYEFSGWATSQNGAVIYENGAMIKNAATVNGATVNLYAVWTANVYKVTLDNQDADFAGTKEYYEKYNTGNYTTSACTTAITNITKPSKTGYTFKGYYTGRNGTGIQYVDATGKILSTTTEFTDRITLYAHWTANTYIIRYDANGGNGTMSGTPATYDRSVPLATNIFEKTGHTFQGWSKTPDGPVEYQDREEVKNLSAADGSTVTLYAVWKVNSYMVTYDYRTNGGASVTKNSISVDYAKPIDLTVTAQKDKYTFVGWNTDSTATTGLASLTMETEPVILYAIYKKDIEVTFVEHGDSGTVTSKLFRTVYNNVTHADFPVNETTNWSGWENVGWTPNTGAMINSGISTGAVYETDKSMTLYARYRSTVELSYDTNGSTMVLDSQEKERYYNAAGNYAYPEYVTARTPILPKHSFVNWQVESGRILDINGNKILNTLPNDRIQVAEDTVLKAVWDKHPEIEAYNRYFTLEEAQAGKITKTELLEKVVATDEEAKTASNPEGILRNGVDVIVKNYNVSDFTSISEEKVLRVIYQAADSFGNVVMKSVDVIVTDTSVEKSSKKTYVRFISDDFVVNETGVMVSSDAGGLEETSVWRINPVYNRLLKETVLNTKSDVVKKEVSALGQTWEIEVAGSGEWTKKEDTWIFFKDNIQDMKEYTHTYGHIRNAAEKFFDLFEECKRS